LDSHRSINTQNHVSSQVNNDSSVADAVMHTTLLLSVSRLPGRLQRYQHHHLVHLTSTAKQHQPKHNSNQHTSIMNKTCTKSGTGDYASHMSQTFRKRQLIGMSSWQCGKLCIIQCSHQWTTY